MIDQQQLADYLDGALDADAAARVESELSHDAEALEYVASQRACDRLLSSVLGSEWERQRVKDSILAAVQGHDERRQRARVLRDTTAPKFWPRLAWWAGLAATAAVVVGLNVWLLRKISAPASPVELVDVRENVAIERGGRSFTATASIPLQTGDTLQISPEGSASVRFADDTRLSLESGASITLRGDDAKQIELTAGRLRAHVAKQASGHHVVIRTPLAAVTVHGTAFALDASARSTRLDVSEGWVRMSHSQKASEMDLTGGEFALALPGADLVGGLYAPPLTPTSSATGDRDYVRRPFSDDSPWNRGIASAAKFDDIESPTIDFTTHGASVLPAGNARPIFIAKQSDTRRKIVSRYQDQDFGAAPMSSDAFTGGDWINGTLIDPAEGVAWEVTGARRRGEEVETMLCVKINLRGPGVPPSAVGNTFSGLPLVAGIIREGELDRGIQHALSAAILHSGLNRNGTGGHPFVWPARHMPMEIKKLEWMSTTGNLHYGTRLAIPRDIDISQLGVGNSGPAFEIARALQVYGAFVTHSFSQSPASGNWVQPHLQLFAELPSNTDFQKLAANVSKLTRHLKVVSNSSSGKK